MQTEYLPKAAKSLAAADLPDGKRYYAFLVRRHTTTSMTPDQIHDLGQSEVKRIRGRMQTVMEQTGFKGTLPEFIAYLRKDPRSTPPAASSCWRRPARSPSAPTISCPPTSALPRLTYGVRPVPASIEKGYTTGRYFGGDPRSAGPAG
jgi:uncharacterized protein (DUF885 family)